MADRPPLSLCWRTFADSNVENAECIKDLCWVLTGDVTEGKHGRNEMLSALFMYLVRVVSERFCL